MASPGFFLSFPTARLRRDSSLCCTHAAKLPLSRRRSNFRSKRERRRRHSFRWCSIGRGVDGQTTLRDSVEELKGGGGGEGDRGGRAADSAPVVVNFDKAMCQSAAPAEGYCSRSKEGGFQFPSNVSPVQKGDIESVNTRPLLHCAKKLLFYSQKNTPTPVFGRQSLRQC